MTTYRFSSRVACFRRTHLVCLLLLLSPLVAPVQAQDTHYYSIWLKGIACDRESNHVWGAWADEPFVVAVVQDYYQAHPLLLPGKGQHYTRIETGQQMALNQMVWEGPVQTVSLTAQLWDFDNAERKAMRTITDLGIGMATAVAAVGTGGLAAAGIAAGGVGLATLTNEIHENLAAGYHDHLGNYQMSIELHRVGTWADAPQHRTGSISYDFVTEHQGD